MKNPPGESTHRLKCPAIACNKNRVGQARRCCGWTSVPGTFCELRVPFPRSGGCSVRCPVHGKSPRLVEKTSSMDVRID
ncbi:MAG: hypothetical protein CMJ69_04865 [Planctomycetaceae bacterium]|nr:hypothetical protein [Planctomycetaceae bacterium]